MAIFVSKTEVGAGIYSTISAAVAAAAIGETITVRDGVYEEDVIINKSVILLSENGQWDEDSQTGVKIVGVHGGALGTVVFTAGSNGSILGDLDQGFTIVGKDSPNPGIEHSAVYLQGALADITIRGNDIVANGDGGLTSEYGLTVTNIVIDSNTFSGQTFVGDTPAGSGFGQQFTLANVPRQLVVMSPSASSTVTFTNNEITGTAGGINADGAEQGNTLVTLDVTNSLIDGNTFSGFTNGSAHALRVRRDGTTISNNTFDASESGSDNTHSLFVQTANPGPSTGNEFFATDGSNIIFADPGNDVHVGTIDEDTFSFAPVATTGAYADLEDGTAFSGQTGFDSLEGIENLAGTAGNDSFFGDDIDNTFFASAGTDTVDGRGQDIVGDTFDATSYSSDVVIDLEAGVATLSNGTTTLVDIENATGGSGDDLLIGDDEGINFLTGNGGDDTFVGNGGFDVIDGGEGFDTVQFAGNYEDYAVTWADGIATVTLISGGLEAAIIVDAGLITFADKALYLVDPLSEEFATVQSAVDAAADQPLDSVIMLAAGTYTEQVVVDGIDNLTIVSAPSCGCEDVVIQAPDDVVGYGSTSSGRPANAVITVTNAANVVIEGVTVDGNGAAGTVDGSNANFFGVFYRNASGELVGVDITGVRDAYPGGETEGGSPVVSGNQRGVGVQVDNDTQLSFKMTGGTISDFQKNATVFNNTMLEVTGVTVIGGGAQTIIAQNGFQVSNSTGTISGNTVTGIGYAGPSDPYSASIMGYGNTDLAITGNTIVGANDEDTAAKVVGIYILDFGAPNSGGSVTGNTISFVDIGVALSGGVTPDTIVVEDNAVTDIDTSDLYAAGVDFYPDADVTVAFDIEGTDARDYLYGAAGNDTLDGLGGNDLINGRDGDDTLIGGEGDDTLIGGDGTDTVILNDTEFSLELLDDAIMVVDADANTAGDQAGWQVDTGTGDGVETVEGVEIVVDMNGARTLLVGGGGFATIAEALLVATIPGDVILVASGHVEPGPITITTANNGVALLSLDGTAAINGAGVNQGSAVRIEAGVEDFTLGSEGHGFEIEAGSGDLAAVYIVGDSNGIIIVGNDIDGASGHAVLTGGGMSDSSISGNELSADGPAAVVYVNGTASLGNASDNVDITGNQISGGPGAGLLVGLEAANSDVSGNTFSGSASYAQLEVFGAGATIADNTFAADGEVAIIDAGNADTDANLIGAQTDFAPGAVWVENPSGEGNVIYTSIQEAIDNAEAGATIHIGEGVFTENLVINKEVHLVGEAGATLQGNLMSLVGVHAGLDEAFEAGIAGYTATIGVTLGDLADGSSINGLTLQGFSKAIDLGSVSGVSIEGNTFVNNVTGIFKVEGAAVTSIAISDNDFSHGIHGIAIHGNAAGSFDGVVADGNDFSAMTEKGMYFEQLSNASLAGNTFDDVGNYGRVPPFGPVSQRGDYGQAIDINLKAENYENVVFTDTSITNSGHSDENGTAATSAFGAAIGVKIRDDGGPASFTGSIVFDGLVIDDTSTGVRVGEPNKNNDGPNVTLTDVTITNATVGEIDNATDPVNGGTTVVEFSATQVDLDASVSQADVDVVGNDLNNAVLTGSGDDTFEGGAGDDTFNGGLGVDTAVYADGDITDVVGGWKVTSLDGEDTLSEVEVIEVGGARTLLVGAGGYDSIAAALADADSGDTIMLAAGTYAENITLAEGVTIIGSAGGDSVVTGEWTITSTDQVHIDGLTFRDVEPVVASGTPPGFLAINDKFVSLTILAHSTEGHVIENSAFERVPSSYYAGFNGNLFAGSNNQPTHRAIEIASVGAGKTISIVDNTFSGENSYPYAGDSWRSGIYSNGGLGTTLIDGNTFENLRSAINADDFTTTVTITNNNFVAAGSAISLGGAGADGSDLSTLYGNQFGTVGTEFNFQGVPGGVVFDAGAAIDGAVGDSGVQIYGSNTGGDDITGTDYADTVIGGGGNDVIDTGDGADAISGGAGIDTITAGEGADTIVGGANADIMDGGEGDDLFLLNSSSEFATGEVITGGDGFDAIVWDAQSYDVLFLTDDVTGIEQVEMLGSSDSLLGVLDVGNSLDIIGNGGDNTIAGTFFADTIDGGAGVDTVEYYMGEAVTNVDGTWVVGGDELTNVEIVNVNGARTLLVGGTGFATIQDALANASAGDTILISEGQYYGELVISLDDITLKAVGDVTLNGDGIVATTDKAVTVSGDNFRIEGIKIDGYYTAVELGNGADGVDIIDVDISGAEVAVRKGTAAVVSDVHIEGGSISDSQQGIVIYKTPGSAIDGHLTGLVVKDVDFSNISQKGIYIETLKGIDNAFTGLTFTDVGHVGQAGTNKFGAGIDINLKAGDYNSTVLVIDDFEFTNVGTSAGGGSPDPTGAAITVKGRDDAPSYSGVPANTAGMVVTISNGTITGTSTGIRQGEPGKPSDANNVTGPALTVENVVITGAAISEIDNVSKSTLTVIAGPADGETDTYEAGTDDTATGSIAFTGNADKNVFTGGLGDDTFFGDSGADELSGGGGDDTFTYESAADLADDELDGGDGFDNLVFDTESDTQITLGADTFGMEQVTIGGAAINLDASAVATGLTLVGNAAANTIIGTQGDDVVETGAGNDTYQYATGNGDDALDGGADTDTLVVSTVGALGVVTVDVTGTGPGAIDVALSGGASGSVSAEAVEAVVVNLGSSDVNSVNLVGDFAPGTTLTVNGGSTRTALVAELLTSTTSVVANLGGGDDTYYFGSGSGNDVLDGGDGFDTLNFAAVDHGVVVDLAKSGTTMATATILNVGVDKAVNFEAVRGSAFFDVIRGNGSANTIFASAGNDFIDGKGGIDTFDARTTLDDMIIDLEAEFVLDSEGIGQLKGMENVFGGRGNDSIVGDAGNNIIDGYVGDDYMEGGDGDDTYYVNTTADQVVEYEDEGTDTVFSITNWTLGDHVENLTLTGTANRTGTGNALDNVIVGNSGNNVINGMAGADTMIGGAGNDTYHVNTSFDTVVELGGEGTDLVNSVTNYRLTANVENLTLTGTMDRWAEGNSEANTIRGNTGNNEINGMAGVDQLWGQGGLDTFVFSAASHTGVGSGNRDVIRDFDANDLIDVSDIATFTLLAQNASLTAGGGAELAWTQSGGNTIISGDSNDDGVADFQIQITGLHTLTADDFLL